LSQLARRFRFLTGSHDLATAPGSYAGLFFQTAHTGTRGLRGLAILLVLVFHYISQEGVLPHGTLADRLQRLAIMSWTGLDLFFVLSGFLIGGILMDARSSQSYFKTFCARRFFRIVPLYYLWIILYVALIATAGGAITRLSNSGIRPFLDLPIFSHFLFLQNFAAMGLFDLAGA
jgi:peptidoglycan/LPS O-acetylase OafA/YrhL